MFEILIKSIDSSFKERITRDSTSAETSSRHTPNRALEENLSEVFG